MNRSRTFVFLFVCIITSAIEPAISIAQDAKTTTFFVVRHADRNGTKDELTEAGVERAEELKKLMHVFRVSAVYSTQYQRTQKTAAPTAAAMKVPVTPYDALTKNWFDQLKKKHAGQSVLIVGHSNTSGSIAEGLGGQGDFSIAENEFDSLFVITIGKNGSQAVRLTYGEPYHSD